MLHFRRKLVIFGIIAIIGVAFFGVKKTRADMWGSNFLAAQAQIAQEQIWQQTQAALVAALKVEASRLLADTVNNLISGANQTASLFITDWESYLFGEPRNATRAYMNDFFTITSRGKSYGNYDSTCGSNFSEWRTSRAQNAVNMDVDLREWQSTFEEFACGYQDMFNDASWGAYIASTDPKNNPIAYTLFAEETENKIQKAKEKEALAKASAYSGFKAQVGEDGTVITPGSFIKDIASAANTMDMDMISNAHNIGEVAGIVVGKIAGNAIKLGIGNARKQVQAKINNQICSASQSLRDASKNFIPNGTLMQSLGIGSLGNTRDSRCVLH